MKSPSMEKTVDSTLKTICKRIPEYAELTERFGPLMLEMAKLRDEFMGETLPEFTVDPARTGAGVPVLVDVDLAPLGGLLRRSTDRLLPVLAEVLRLDDTCHESLKELLGDEEQLLGLVRARIDGNGSLFENTSVKIDIPSPTTLLFIVESIMAPPLRTVVGGLAQPLSELAWDDGHCPVCGSTPSISQLSPKEITDLDLVGGGGKKYLHCSLCGHDWRFKRNACPACGNDDSQSREVFYTDDARFERIEACHKCGKYCLNIDMRECEPLPDLDAIQLGLIHLDMAAQKKELEPISPTLWNSID